MIIITTINKPLKKKLSEKSRNKNVPNIQDISRYSLRY